MNLPRDPQRERDPHADSPLHAVGPAPEDADATLVLVHGRGASAASILSLYDNLPLSTLAGLAPQAAEFTWYPHSFLAPLESNQPYLDSALNRLESIVVDLLARGVPTHRIALLGFSQGACLASEYIARHPRRYGAAVIFTGGLIGPPGTPRDYPGSLDGTPIFLGTSNPDSHVPFERVLETKAVFERLNAIVELREYPGMPHTINDDELAAAQALLQAMTANERRVSG